MPYQVVLLSPARRFLDRLDAAERSALLGALRRQLPSHAGTAEQIVSDGRAYSRARLSPGYWVLYRPLTHDEIGRLAGQRVLRDPATPGYAVLTLERGDGAR